jgi:hypothetical protein
MSKNRHIYGRNISNIAQESIFFNLRLNPFINELYINTNIASKYVLNYLIFFIYDSSIE